MVNVKNEIEFMKNVRDLKAEVDLLIRKNKLVEACKRLSERGWEMIYNPVDVQRFRKNRIGKIFKKAIENSDFDAIDMVRSISSDYGIFLDAYLIRAANIICIEKKPEGEEFYVKEVE